MMLRRIPSDEWGRDKDVWQHECAVYLIQEEAGPIKVGVTDHPVRRLSRLQCGNPRELYLRVVFAGERQLCLFAEKAILSRYKPCIIRGEWIKVRLEEVVSELEHFTGDANAPVD